jgi:hypothetical protein
MKAMLSGCGLSNSTLALTNYLVAVTTFLQLVVVAEWFGLPEIGDRTIAKDVRMTVPAEIAELGLGLVEDP